jgi:hypothetical protein
MESAGFLFDKLSVDISIILWHLLTSEPNRKLLDILSFGVKIDI